MRNLKTLNLLSSGGIYGIGGVVALVESEWREVERGEGRDRRGLCLWSSCGAPSGRFLQVGHTSDDGVDGISEVFHFGGSETGHGDAAVGKEIHVELLNEALNLLG